MSVAKYRPIFRSRYYPRNIVSVPITFALNYSNPNNFRTNDQLIARRAFDLSDGLPSGPWFDSHIANNEFNQWAYKFTSGGGCFKLICGSTRKKGKQKITWTRKDVYNNFASKPGERYLDATNFVEFLQNRYNLKDLFFEVMTDSDGCLVNAFWLLIDALHRWSDNFSNNVHTVKNPKVPLSKGRSRQKRIRGINESYRYKKKDGGRKKRSKSDVH